MCSDGDFCFYSDMHVLVKLPLARLVSRRRPPGVALSSTHALDGSYCGVAFLLNTMCFLSLFQVFSRRTAAISRERIFSRPLQRIRPFSPFLQSRPYSACFVRYCRSSFLRHRRAGPRSQRYPFCYSLVRSSSLPSFAPSQWSPASPEPVFSRVTSSLLEKSI